MCILKYNKLIINIMTISVTSALSSLFPLHGRYNLIQRYEKTNDFSFKIILTILYMFAY